jgi:hypothetical protein
MRYGNDNVEQATSAKVRRPEQIRWQFYISEKSSPLLMRCFEMLFLFLLRYEQKVATSQSEWGKKKNTIVPFFEIPYIITPRVNPVK